MSNLIEHHMGVTFKRLAPILQSAHSGHKILRGEAYVTRGNALAKIICSLLRFPKEYQRVTLEVDCQNSSDEMWWRRRFGKLEMESRFVERGAFLVEYLRGMALYFRAVEIDGALHYHFHKTRFWGIPLPKFLAPKVIAYEEERDGAYHFKVEVSLFLIGLTIAYGGVLDLFEAE